MSQKSKVSLYLLLIAFATICGGLVFMGVNIAFAPKPAAANVRVENQAGLSAISLQERTPLVKFEMSKPLQVEVPKPVIKQVEQPITLPLIREQPIIQPRTLAKLTGLDAETMEKIVYPAPKLKTVIVYQQPTKQSCTCNPSQRPFRRW